MDFKPEGSKVAVVARPPVFGAKVRSSMRPRPRKSAA
jgi:hypothetical protein